jgi:hypothetical protein
MIEETNEESQTLENPESESKKGIHRAKKQKTRNSRKQ